ncbi:MAG: NADP-dependent oxidoreductase [Sulfobacillus thermotolerans]|uniref:NADPH:quinone reductase n=1 Tax=Sulfobacillus thermotolerans TaxID=338644 RepID=A0ABM6RTR7_9FIRM|nr:NADPH:quinone reductase [Sulfobacillus thermotolerans]MCY0906767.1 NADP-dependent oxidoreductase [Sulfobacillus thermotolerans]
MKAMVIDQYGPPEVFREAVMEPIPLGPHDVLVNNFATSVNPVDWKIRKGYLAERLPLSFPAILGWDSAGIVEAVGPDVKNFRVGDRVFSRPATERPGTYSDYVVIDESLVAPKPSTLTFLEAASVPLAGLTAWEALVEIAQIQPGMRVLVHAGAGGVGGYAIQLAKAYQAFVVTTARASNLDYVKDLGADEAVDYETQSFEKMYHDFDVVLDTMGGAVQEKSFGVLKPGGILVSVAQMPDPATAKAHHVRAEWFFLQPNGAKLTALGQLFETGRMRPVVGQVFPLAQIARAHRLSETMHTRGKIGIVVDEGRAYQK